MQMSEDQRVSDGARPTGRRVRSGSGVGSGMLLAAAFALAGTALVFTLTSTTATGLSLPPYVSATPKPTTVPPPASTTTTTLPVIRRAVTQGTTTYITPLPKVSVEDDNGRTLENEGRERGDDPPGPPPKGDS